MDGPTIRQLRSFYYDLERPVEAIASMYGICEATVRKFIDNPDRNQPLTELEKAEVRRVLVDEQRGLNYAARRVGLSNEKVLRRHCADLDNLLVEVNYDPWIGKRRLIKHTPEKLESMLTRLENGQVTRKELSAELGVSRSRVDQILNKAERQRRRLKARQTS